MSLLIDAVDFRAIDDGVGRIIDWVDQQGLADDTMIIYTSDQGFFIGWVGLAPRLIAGNTAGTTSATATRSPS